MQPSLFALLPQLPTLHLALLVAGTRLETIHNLTTVNFALVYSHYSELLARSKLQRSASSTLASGGAFTGAGLRLWSKDTARGRGKIWRHGKQLSPWPGWAATARQWGSWAMKDWEVTLEAIECSDWT